ncbi:hypothetical protein [Maricaulis sp.]|uniref:hypothetical protein n=1 Tax=Maricaulis sp. TaxID=1486257 RepID=UPI00329710B9
MKRILQIIATIGVAASLTACASLVTGGPLVRPGEPTGVLEIVNGSSRTFTAILISNCSAASYGLNRLPSGVTVPPGRSYRFTVSAGCWDVDAGLAYNEARFRTRVPAGRLVRHTVVDGR